MELEFNARSVRSRVIWFVPQPTLVHAQKPDVDSDWPVLSDPRQAVAAMKSAIAGDSTFGMPWSVPPRNRGQMPAPAARPRDNFWLNYHELQPGDNASARQCARRLTPLRWYGGDSHSAVLAASDMRVSWETFVYAHGTAVVATLHFEHSPGVPLAQTIDVIAAARTAKWEVVWNEGDESAAETMTTTVRSLVQRAESHRVVRDMISTALPRPFVVSAVIAGHSARAIVYPDEDSHVHQQLEGLASLERDWRDHTLARLDAAIISHSSKAGFIYGLERGRTIWHPGKAMRQTQGRVTTLGCYSRNVTMLAMQMEALASLLYHSTGPRSPAVMSNNHRRMISEAINVIGRHFTLRQLTPLGAGGYYSRSSQRHLEDLGAVQSVRAACALLGRKAPEGWPAS